MATILLYGHLAKQYGRRHSFQVSNPAEAVRALRANYPGFEQAVLSHGGGYHVMTGYEDRVGERLGDVCSDREVIRIVPSVSGAGIETIAFYVFANTALGVAASWAVGALISIAISVAISSIASALLAPSKSDSSGSERAENKPSYLFNGPVNTTAQGNPVPIGYGRLRVGSQVISTGVSAEQVSVDLIPIVKAGGSTFSSTPEEPAPAAP